MLPKSRQQLRTEELRRRLNEAEQTLEAIRSGTVDAVVVGGPGGEGARIYTLEGADRPYRLLIEQMQQGAATLNPDGTIAYSNPRLAELLGVDTGTLSGANLTAYVAEADRPWFSNLLHRGRIGTTQGETHLERADGVPVPVYLTVSALENVASAPLCVLVTDLTDAKFEDLYEFAPDMMCSLEVPSGLILQCNHTLARVLGLPKSKILRRPIFDFYSDSCRDRARKNFRDFGEHGELQDDELQLIRQDGSTLYASVSVSAVRDPQGRIVRSRSILRDISDRKRAEEALRDADQRKDEFLAILAHELRNPLAPIRNAVEIFRLKAPSDPELSWSGDVIDRQVNQLTRLVDDLLDVSRITRNKIELRRSTVAMQDLVKAAVEACQPVLDAGNHKLDLRLTQDPLWVDADAARITQVLGNLLNNAAKYTPPGGRIAVTAAREDGWARIGVSDNGIGIAPELQPRIFNMFVQAEAARERSQGGLGIGLTLVKSMVELHGGSVQVISRGLGQGCEFVVQLPLSARPAVPAEAGSAEAAKPALRRRRVLVVDDNKDAADTIGMLLGMWGHEVRTASSGAEAIELARKNDPEVILMDIGMPTMNGYEAARHILDRPHQDPIVMIALTGWGQESDRMRTREAGFMHHLTKPVSPECLQSIFSTLDQGH